MIRQGLPIPTDATNRMSARRWAKGTARMAQPTYEQLLGIIVAKDRQIARLETGVAQLEGLLEKKPRAPAGARRRRSPRDCPRKTLKSPGARAAGTTVRKPIARCRIKNATSSSTCPCPRNATNAASSWMEITSINSFRWRFRGDRSSDDLIYTLGRADNAANAFGLGTRCRRRTRSGRPPRSWVRISRP